MRPKIRAPALPFGSSGPVMTAQTRSTAKVISGMTHAEQRTAHHELMNVASP